MGSNKPSILTNLAICVVIGSIYPKGAGDIEWNEIAIMTDMDNVHYIDCDHQCTENILTPNLDRIGREGLIFRKTYDAFQVSARKPPHCKLPLPSQAVRQ